MTLEAIGAEYGITRERVRQIIEGGMRLAREKAFEARGVSDLTARARGLLEERGNICREDVLFGHLGGDRIMPFAAFLLLAGGGVHRCRETQGTHAFWALHDAWAERAIQVSCDLVRLLEEAGRVLDSDALDREHCRVCRSEEERAMVPSVLLITKRIMPGYGGDGWGLREWPHVNPRNIRDKAHLILHRERRPLHFREVRSRIEQLEADRARQKDRCVLAQTVHNELIKDARFVLVGRGTYGLRDWGYRPGTVKDVIESLLREEGALSRDEVVRRTLEQRQVKESTIFLNLQDRARFARDGEGRYHVA